jgi:hypothetical protein
MARRILGLVLFGVFTGSLATVGAWSAPAKSKQTPPIDASQLPAGHFLGTLVSPPDADRIFTVTVRYQQLVLNPKQNFRAGSNLQAQYNHILQLQKQLQNPRNRNPGGTMNQLQQALLSFQQQLTQAQLSAFKLVNASQNVDFQAAEDMKVRLLKAPAVYDDKGNIKRSYTPAEMKELKGKNPNLPGFESSVDALKAGMNVQVTLGKHRTLHPATPGKDKDATIEEVKEKDKTTAPQKDAPKDNSSEKKMQAQMIVILDITSAADTTTSPGASQSKQTSK